MVRPAHTAAAAAVPVSVAYSTSTCIPYIWFVVRNNFCFLHLATFTQTRRARLMARTLLRTCVWRRTTRTLFSSPLPSPHLPLLVLMSFPSVSSPSPLPPTLLYARVQMVAMRQYQVVGRKAVTEKEPNPAVYRMKVTFFFLPARRLVLVVDMFCLKTRVFSFYHIMCAMQALKELIALNKFDAS